MLSYWRRYEAFVNHYAAKGFLSPQHKILHIQYAHATLCECLDEDRNQALIFFRALPNERLYRHTVHRKIDVLDRDRHII